MAKAQAGARSRVMAINDWQVQYASMPVLHSIFGFCSTTVALVERYVEHRLRIYVQFGGLSHMPHRYNAKGCLGVDICLRSRHVIDIIRHRNEYLRKAGHRPTEGLRAN